MKRPSRALGLSSLFAALPAVSACAQSAPAREAANVVWIDPKPPSQPASAAPAPPPPTAAPEPRDGPQPHRFWHLVVGEVTERRDWVRVDRSTWEERYPTGAVMRYRIVGRLREGGRNGVLARRVPSGDVEVLVPDIGSIAWPATRVVPDGDWHDLGPMHVID